MSDIQTTLSYMGFGVNLNLVLLIGGPIHTIDIKKKYSYKIYIYSIKIYTYQTKNISGLSCEMLCLNKNSG